jgi:hypothetical protein
LLRMPLPDRSSYGTTTEADHLIIRRRRRD